MVAPTEDRPSGRRFEDDLLEQLVTAVQSVDAVLRTLVDVTAEHNESVRKHTSAVERFEATARRLEDLWIKHLSPVERAPSFHDLAKEAAKEAVAEVTGEHRAVTPSDNPGKIAWWDKRILGPALRWVAVGILVGFFGAAGAWAFSDCEHAATRGVERR